MENPSLGKPTKKDLLSSLGRIKTTTIVHLTVRETTYKHTLLSHNFFLDFHAQKFV
jgi:hypothetical protein